MTTRDVRVLALWRDDPLVAPMTIDLRLDETGALASAWDLFGVFDLDSANCRPFVLRRNGTLDFGAADAQRWRTDLRSVAICVNACFTVHWNETDCGVYKIVKIAELGVKDGRK
ncbi:MAG TPA: hypothetical protein VEH76_11030 [Methylocystis sp.]|nr:hypothetical protein [Methylocystis sp.]